MVGGQSAQWVICMVGGVSVAVQVLVMVVDWQNEDDLLPLLVLSVDRWLRRIQQSLP